MTSTHHLVLASASPARRQLLGWAGLDVEVDVSGVEEDVEPHLATPDAVEALAVRKASAVAARRAPCGDRPELVIGCDSALDVDGEMRGKPGDPATATNWWRERRGRRDTLHSGLCLIDTATGRQVSGSDRAIVAFGHPTDAEIDAYVGSGEPLQVAGGFTMEGRGAAFLDAIDGHPSTVMGLSLPLLATLVRELTGCSITELWSPG